jgi:hypothetical protein
MSITLTNDQYAALVSLASKSTTDSLLLDQFLKEIETANSITRYFLRIRWQECNLPLPANTNFPTTWPPTQESSLTRYDRPVARVDVETEVSRLAANPVDIMVTRDPNGLLGWTKLADYFLV